MKKETQLNTVISNSIKRYSGFNHKISDPMMGTGTQKPFDGFGMINNKPLYYEAKLIKGGIYSFNFNTLEDHQKENLKMLSNGFDKTIPNKYYTLVVVGFFKPKDFCYLMLFDYKTIEKMINSGKNSFLKKELEVFISHGKYLEIKYEKLIIDGKTKRKQFVQNLDSLNEVII